MTEQWRPGPPKEDLPSREVAHLNIYNNVKFRDGEARERLDGLVDAFKNRYASLGYQEQSEVLISSGMDPTVRFIGSHISVLKPYLVEDRVPTPGVFMRQRCLRTRNADTLLDDNIVPNWGSYFLSMGALAHPERLEDVCDELFNFFENDLRVVRDNILLRVSSKDADLISACTRRYSGDNIEIDSRQESYYRHKIGVEGVTGRNFNFALRNPDGQGFSDVGNVIVLSNSAKMLGVEVALGTSTILKNMFSLDHVQDCHPVSGLGSSQEGIYRKFQDAVITSTVLCREGLRPFGQHNRNRILKQYVKSLSYFRAKSSLSLDGLKTAIQELEKREFVDTGDSVAIVIMELVAANERDILSRDSLSEDDRKIKLALITLNT